MPSTGFVALIILLPAADAMLLTVGVGRLNLIKIRASGSERTEQGHVGGQWAAMKKRRKETFHILIIYRGALGCAQPKKCFSVAQICRCDLCT